MVVRHVRLVFVVPNMGECFWLVRQDLVDMSRFCGNSDPYCGAGCQANFGVCQITTTHVTTGVNGQGTCGPNNGGATCPKGQCCSPEVRILKSVKD